MTTFLLITVLLIKFTLPFFILRWPFQASWTNYFLDVVDGDILLSLGMSDSFYQTIDKVADYFTYIIMLIVGLKWNVRKLIIILFIYRTIGQVLFFTTGNELSLFYFQNFLEPLFMAYSFLIFRNKSEPYAFKSYKRHIKLVWAIVLVYKIWNEWYLHLANIDLSKYFLGITGGE